MFGKPAYGDLNRDGRDDAVLFRMHDPGGSGTFYYVAAEIADDDIYVYNPFGSGLWFNK